MAENSPETTEKVKKEVFVFSVVSVYSAKIKLYESIIIKGDLTCTRVLQWNSPEELYV